MAAKTTRNTEVIATVPLPNGGTRTISMTVEHLGYWVGVQVTYRDTGDRTARDFSSQGWPDDSIVEPARKRAIEILTPDTAQRQHAIAA